MNPAAEPAQPAQLHHRPSTSCDRHPDEHFTGFCPSCLCERLAVLDHSSSASSSSRKPPLASSTAAALKSIFKPGGGSGGGGKPTFFPELRRTKSFSASKNEGFSGVFEPQRKSCDVRVRNTLWSLFTQDDERNPYKREQQQQQLSDTTSESRNLGSSARPSFQGPVFESKEEEKSESEEDNDDDDDDDDDDYIKVLDEPDVGTSSSNVVIEEKIEEIIEEEEKIEEVLEEELNLNLKPMKDHIDVDSQTKKGSGRDFKDFAGSFWSAASVFSKKLQKWRQKQKLKKRSNGSGSARLPVEKPISRQYRETQSEIADYGFGRRSCDTDPRFSLDAGRISFDDPRYSFDEPRASWDGYLVGRTFPRMPTMLSVVEDAPVVHVARSDTQIPVEEPTMNAINEEEVVPGGSAQTRDYYLDSSSKRRKSLDRSNSIRKTAAAVVAEIDEMKSVSNAKVSPATVDYFQGPKLVLGDKDLRDSNSNSLRDDCSETFEMNSRDNASVVGNGERKGNKKSKRWTWNLWGLGFIHRRSVNKDEDEDRYSRANGVERSYSESWRDLRGERNGEVKGAFNPKLLRSNSSVSWRNLSNFGGSFGGLKKNGVEVNGHGRKKKEEFVLERNRSARYSPNNLDNGLLRFYLAPMGNSQRGSGKSRTNHAHSIARSIMRLY
ncbi:protein OCTOPUS-like [Mangifera indica]|uniref:protein OCTOPUS-like n=1 Tax=Mangifera indica TaxID=29780 RepID=UPI001CFA9CD9|nr:protein OCTOPUS-like [Mangifera indica]